MWNCRCTLVAAVDGADASAAARQSRLPEGTTYEEDSVWMEITVPAGRGRGAYIAGVSGFDEQEYTIRRGSRFAITGERHVAGSPALHAMLIDSA